MGDGAVARFVHRIAPHIVGRDAQLTLLREHLRRAPEGMTSKDTIPREVAEWIRADLEPCGSRRRAIMVEAGVSLSPAFLAKKRGFRRQTLWRLGQETGSRRLLELASSDVYWDRVVSVEYKGDQDVYDLEVEGDHNFVADGLIVHNSHSAAYALVAYQCGWLKANHPAEFMAATMSSEMGDSSRLLTLVEECRRMGLVLLPPDVNRSAWKFTIEDGKIRIGLGAVRNVGQGAVEVLLAARAAHGPFATLFDLVEATPPGTLNKRVVESLVAAGAFDALGPRERLHAGAGLALDHASAQHRERASGQSSLFGDSESTPGTAIAPPLPDVPVWTSRDRGAREKEVLGFYFSEHPLEHLRADIERVATHGIARALELGDGAEVRIVGLVGEIRQLTTRAGKLMGIVMLEDLSGRVECTVFPEAYEQARESLQPDAVVIASGRIEVRDDRGIKLLLNEVKPWEGARQQYQAVLHIEVRAEELTEERILGMDEVLSAYPGDSDVVLHIVKPDHSRMAMRSRRFRVRAHDGLIAGLKARVPSCRVRWGKGGA
jgi:DNA polymerase-3 subunit alpha